MTTSKDDRIQQLERELDSAKHVGAEFKYLSLQLLKELENVTREVVVIDRNDH